MNTETFSNLVKSLVENQYLVKEGYIRSLIEGKVVDASGEPIPWFTYPAIDLLKERVKPDLRVFEFGSGYGTMWWAKHAKKVTTVEHSREWFEKMRPLYPKNVCYLYCELEYGGKYCTTPTLFDPIKFDIIIVDGRDRVNCMHKSVDALSEGGVMILDNANRANYGSGSDYVKSCGYKELKLYGPTPSVSHENATSFFYRLDNCLGL